MIPKSVPTYLDIFGPPVPAYEDLLRDVPPGSGIVYCISLNGELSAPGEFGPNQMRIFHQVISAFSQPEQVNFVSNMLRLGRVRNDNTIGEIFFKQFILAMLVNELNRGAGKPIAEIPTEGQYKMLQAYLLTVQEQYKIERSLLDEAIANSKKSDGKYRLLWGPLMRQFQVNETVSPLVELSKLFWLMKFAFDQWREHLRDYLHTFNFKTIGTFAGSYYSLFTASAMTLPDKPLQKFITIGDANRSKHLAHLRINELMDKPGIRLRDLKKKPIFQLPTGQYVIIDQNYLYKHIFRGPFFDLQKDKDGKLISKNYLSDVSIEVLEKYAFRSITMKLNAEHGRLEFDDGQVKGVGIPDCYNRIRKVIFLVESKAAIFPDDLWETPDHEKFKAYLEERFVKSKGSPKGVTQLVNNIKIVITGGYPFDPISPEELDGIEIYPIIVHNDFQFSMPGINQFLQEHFEKLLTFKVPPGVKIHPLTMINLDWLFDLSLRKGTFAQLKELVDRYHKIIEERQVLIYTTGPDKIQGAVVGSNESFDLVYQLIFTRDLPKISENDDLRMEELFSFAGLTQEILNTEV